MRVRPALPDLFGEIPVSQGDVDAWMLAVPGIAPDSPRFAYYVRTYLVVEKIRAAKLEGSFEERVSSPARLYQLPPASTRAPSWRR